MSKKATSIRTIRAYDVDVTIEGYRVLVDRLWPRGVRKDALKLDKWLKELAPTTALRKWFGHDENKWEEFQNRYRDELSDKREALQSLLADAGERPIVLIYAARDEQHNHATVLQSILRTISS